MSRGIFTTFGPEAEETIAIEGILPIIARSLEIAETTPATRLPNLIDVLHYIYKNMAPLHEEHLLVIFTDLTGDMQEITRLLRSIPSNISMQIIAVNVVGAQHIAALQNLGSHQLSFMIMARDEETQRIQNQMAIDHMRGGPSNN